jgi:hypothetical protein
MNAGKAERIERFSTAFEAEGKLAATVREGNLSQTKQSVSLEDENGFPLPSTRPYPGLRAFTPREARLFFGRRREAAELRKCLADSNVVIVLGGSGSGKSSLVLAGVLPRLNDVGRIPGRSGRWYTVTFRPGDSPCQRMVEALWNDVCLPLISLKHGPRAFDEILGPASLVEDMPRIELRRRFEEILHPEGKLTVAGVNAFLAKLDEIDKRISELRGGSRSGRINLLLLIDQFEELFRDTVRNEKQNDVRMIVKLLQYVCGHRDGPLVVVVTLRSEELHRCTEIEGLARVINSGFYLIDRPDIDALDMATVNPGQQTLLDWNVFISDEEDGDDERENTGDYGNAPFSTEFIKKLNEWIKNFQEDEFAAQGSAERGKRHQADLLPLFQHLLRISWTAAVGRWTRDRPEKATVEVADIEKWIEVRRKRVGELRDWMRTNSAVAVSEVQAEPDNMLERCFDAAFAVTLSEAITGNRWDTLATWPASDEKMRHRLRLIQAALVALATRDDKGNDARRPASAAEILAASHDEASEKELKDVLSFFKSRDYLQGGERGERYDVSHEALIRNSTEYQTWLADAKKVTDALTRANAVLDAARADVVKPELETNDATLVGRIWRPLRRVIGKVLAPKEIWTTYFLTDLRDAGARFSESMSRELARIFGARAVFSPAWMAERAQLGETTNEQLRTCENIEETWTKAYRWHVDIDAQRKDENPYFGSRIVKTVRNMWHGPDLRSTPTAGRTLRAFRAGALVNLLVVLFVILPLFSAVVAFGVRPLQQKVRLFSEYAANNQTSDFRLKLLLLASALRSSETWVGLAVLDPSDLKQKAREVLLRSPVFGGTFASAAWNSDGTRVITMKEKNDDLIVYNLLDEKDGKAPKQIKASPLPSSTYEPEIAPPPSIGFIKQKDGSEIAAAFRIVSGSVWTGKEGSSLEEASKLLPAARKRGQWIPRADIFKNHVRIVFLSFSESVIIEMNVLDLPGSELASLSQKNQELIDWDPRGRQAFRQPVLAEDCNAYAFLGKDNPKDNSDAIKQNDTEPFFRLWLREPEKDVKDIRLKGIYVKGAVAISRECKSAVARNDSEEEKQRLYLVRFGDGQAASEPVSISLDSLNRDFAKGTYPVGGQSQAELAAAPYKNERSSWRIGWPTAVGLAILDISEGSGYVPKPAVPPPAPKHMPDQKQMPDQEQMLNQKQMLTGLESGYELGSLSFSPDGTRALLMRQYSFASPIRVRAFNLDFDDQWKNLAEKGTDELVQEACRIAAMQDGSNQLSKAELNIWLKDENGPQPCP